MNPTDTDDLLWEMSRRTEPAGDPPPADEILTAYREGRLADEESERVEALLAASPSARARLAELAGVAPAMPPPALRSQVLARFPSRAPRSRVRRWLPAVALAASLAVVIGYSVLHQPGLPAGLDYQVTASGVARQRSAGAISGTVEAFPETRVRLVIEPQGDAVADVGFGIYRGRGGSLERLALDGPLTLETRRGAAVVTGPASSLVGDQPGTYDLYVVAARPGDLPARFDLEPGADPEALLEDGGRRIAGLVRLHLLAPPTLER